LVSDNILVEKLLLGEAVRGYHLSLKASRYSSGYIASMEICLRGLAEYARAHRWPGVSRITTLHIEEYLVYLQERPSQLGKRSPKPRLSASSVETHYRRLKTFFAWLKQRGYIETNPLDLIQHPKIEERVIPTVPDQQILDLLELVDPRHARTPAERFRALRNRAIIWLLVDTPIRRAELAGLSVDNIDLDAGTVTVMGKGRRERVMPLGETSLLALWDYLQVRQSRLTHLWLDEHGYPLTAEGIYIFLKRLGKRAGILNLHAHRFRHTFATSYLRSGGSERYLRIVGGWRRIPDTYFRTIDAEDVARAHRQLSPGDRLSQQLKAHGRSGSKTGLLESRGPLELRVKKKKSFQIK